MKKGEFFTYFYFCQDLPILCPYSAQTKNSYMLTNYLLCFQRSLEKPKEGAQTEAIHVVQLGQVTDHKEQRTATLS